MGRTVPIDVLHRFTAALVEESDVAEILWEFADAVSQVLEVSGAGVSLASGGALTVAVVTSEAVRCIEAVQQETKQGPCQEAYESGQTWRVPDIDAADQWPEYQAIAKEVGMRSVMGVPLRFRGRSIGALNVYHAEPRDWGDDDLAVCQVLGNMATSFVAHHADLVSAQQLSDQLQVALDSRVVIEQAKGILAEHHDVSVQQAFERMRSHARSNNVSLRSVAIAVVERGFRLPPA